MSAIEYESWYRGVIGERDSGAGVTGPTVTLLNN
jgi:hypothetical protein